MHDALAYQRDTEIVDLDDLDEPQPSIARSRVDTGDLTVHVYIDGAWHRLDPFTLDAACGAKVTANSARLNERAFKFPLSRDCRCFTELELERADDSYRQKFGTDIKPRK
jgi:hypothetical protein